MIFIGCIVLFSVPFSIKSDNVQLVPIQGQERACEVVIKVGEQRVPLETYLIGVIAAEMPASFHLEALKAQAIAARTYALKKTEFGELPIQATTAHQVYETKEEREEKWQAVSSQYESKIEQAVRETAGLVAMYDAELITAMFHASSFEMTESAKNYSGNSLTYLQSVATTEMSDDERSYTVNELNQKLATSFSLQQYARAKLTLNDSGRVATVTIGQQQWSGRTFRELLALKSTAFTINIIEGKVHIRTKGYGHGVGMSQYGANEMASRGERAEDILRHYYQGIEITSYTCKKDV